MLRMLRMLRFSDRRTPRQNMAATVRPVNKRSYFARAPQPVTITEPPDMAALVRRLERLSPTPTRPDQFFELKAQLVPDLRRLAAVDRSDPRRKGDPVNSKGESK